MPLQESIPYLKRLPFLNNEVDVIGDKPMISHLKTRDEQYKTNQGSTYCPLICFESIYQLFVAGQSTENKFLVTLSNET